MENNKQERGKFSSNFGFLMAAVGSAVGLGNLWGFPVSYTHLTLPTKA